MDMGTNSIRLLLVRLHPNHPYTILTQLKQIVRLGEGEFTYRYLQPPPWRGPCWSPSSLPGSPAPMGRTRSSPWRQPPHVKQTIRTPLLPASKTRRNSMCALSQAQKRHG